MLLFQKGNYVFSFDLKAGYHHIDIFEPHRQFLGFRWDQGDLQLSPSYVTIKIPKSKTDQQQGTYIIIARTSSDTCPVTMLENT